MQKRMVFPSLHQGIGTLFARGILSNLAEHGRRIAFKGRAEPSFIPRFISDISMRLSPRGWNMKATPTPYFRAETSREKSMQIFRASYAIGESKPCTSGALRPITA